MQSARNLPSAGFSQAEVDNIRTSARSSVTFFGLEDSTDTTLVAPAVLEGALMGVSDISDHDLKVAAVEILTTCIILSSQSVALESRIEIRPDDSVSVPQASVSSYTSLLKTITNISIRYMDDIGITSDSVNTVIVTVVEGITETLKDAGISDGDLPSAMREITEGAVVALDEAGIAAADIADAIDAVTSGAFKGLKGMGLGTTEIAQIADDVAAGAAAGAGNIESAAADIVTIINSIQTGVNDGLAEAGLSDAEINALQDEIEEAAEAAASGTPVKIITAFKFPASDNSALSADITGTINETGKTITVTIPFGVAVTSLKPTITIIGASISPACGTAQDFSSPVTYTVTTSDGTTQAYTVSVSSSLPALEAYIKADTGDSLDYLGKNVSLSGETLAVGVPEEDSNQTTITASGSADNISISDCIGSSVSLSGHILAVGAYNEDSNQTNITTSGSTDDSVSNSGAVYIFR